MCGRIYPPSEWSKTGELPCGLGNTLSWAVGQHPGGPCQGVPKGMPTLGGGRVMTSKVLPAQSYRVL